MSDCVKVVVVSDIHYAGAAERSRGWREARVIRNPFLRLAVRLYRRYVWLRDPFAHNDLLDRFLHEAKRADVVVANGDFSCDSAFVGLSDDAAFQSANECLNRLRGAYGQRLRLTIGDHELGKMSLFGRAGGLRLASWNRTCGELGLLPFWSFEVGRHVFMGVTSTLLGFPVYAAEVLSEEEAEWRRLSACHLSEVSAAFASLKPDQRVVLFCHDPSALPFLGRNAIVRSRLEQVSATIIGHLHSPLYMRMSRMLSGMPTIGFLGTSIRRMSSALREARQWRPFKVRLCPGLAGIELRKDGGYLEMELDPSSDQNPRFIFRPIPWGNSISS